uniref:Uncharacterized protein n=1 Tax=Parascaris univalens TaxID=6257 RepID=A0A915BPY0_PARUN
MRTLEVDVGRCLCVHSSFQAIDVAIQSILYQRSFVPALVSQIALYADSRKEQTFAIQYNKIRDSLRQLFRSYNRHHLRSVVLLIGGCHLLPKELYHFMIGDCHSSDTGNPGECSSGCSELSNKEMRQLGLTLTVDFDLSDIPTLPQAVCAYVLVNVGTGAQYPTELFTPYESFEMPSEEKAKKRNMIVSCISLKHHCSSVDYSSSSNNESIWLRLDPVLHRLNA